MHRPAGARGHAARFAGVPALACATIAALAGAACAPPPGQQLCEAIAKKDVAGVHAALQRGAVDLLKNEHGCTPVQAAFSNTGPDDKALTEIGLELVRAGLPAEAAWEPKDGGRVTAIEAAATSGNAALVHALLAVGLPTQSKDAIRALHAAAGAGRVEVVRAMVEFGLDPEVELAGRTPAATAHAHERADVEKFLTDEIATRAAAAEMAAKLAEIDAKEAAEQAAKAAKDAGEAPAPQQ